MSGKRIPILCPQCGGQLIVRRSSFKIATHPLYIKKGKIVVNYDRCIQTEQRASKFWLLCSKCKYETELSDEQAILNQVGIIAYEFPPPEKIEHHIHKKNHTHHKEIVKVEQQSVLPRIIRPSKIV